MTIIHKFEPEQKDKSSNLGKNKITFSLGLLIFILILAQIWVSHTVVNYGDKLKNIESLKKAYVSENQVLENEIAVNSSLSYIASQSASLGLNVAKDVKYIR